MAETIEALSRAIALRCVKAFDGVIRLDTDEDVSLWIDGRKTPPAVLTADPGLAPDADGLVVWTSTIETLLRGFEDERALASVFVSGRLSIAGDMSVMARLEFGGAD